MTRTSAVVWFVIMTVQMVCSIILLLEHGWLALVPSIVGVAGFISCGQAMFAEEETDA